MHVHHHEHDHDCDECKDKDNLSKEEEDAEDSDSSELPDDYDPDAVTQVTSLKTKQSSIKLSRKKTVMYPLKLSKEEKK